MGAQEMGRIEELQHGIDALHAELRECRDQHAASLEDRAGLRGQIAVLQAADVAHGAAIVELKAANADLLKRLLDGPTGPGGRAAREDARFKLLIDRFGTPLGKAIAAGSALVLAALASWWAGRFGLGIPTSPTTAPHAIVAPVDTP